MRIENGKSVDRGQLTEDSWKGEGKKKLAISNEQLKNVRKAIEMLRSRG